MKVFRIEDHEGYGMYRSYSSRGFHRIAPMDNERHPSPWEDSLFVSRVNEMGIDAIRSEFFYGFASVNQLRSWIFKDEWLQKLHQNGFRVSVYDIADHFVIVGHSQAAFRRAKMDSVEHHVITQFFSLNAPELPPIPVSEIFYD